MPISQLEMIPMEFPMQGVHESSAVSEQPPGTSPHAINVRGYDLPASRDRGCQRVGVSKATPERNGTSAIDIICVSFLGKVAAGPWTVSAVGDGGSGTGLDYTVNDGLKISRHGGAMTLTVQQDGSSPGAMTGANSGDAFFHPDAASPNPDNLGGGEWEYPMTTGVFDDNGVLGDMATSRTMTLIGKPWGDTVLIQAGEIDFFDNFPYSDGSLPSVSAGVWTLPNGEPASPTNSMLVVSGELTVAPTGTITNGADPLGTITSSACTWSDTGSGVNQTSTSTIGITYSGTNSYSAMVPAIFIGASYQAVSPSLTAALANWPIGTSDFEATGTRFYCKITFKLDSTKVTYLQTTLKTYYDGIPRGFGAVFGLGFRQSSTQQWLLVIRYDSLLDGWLSGVFTNNTAGALNDNAYLMDFGGGDNTLEFTKTGATATVKLNGVTISTTVPSWFPTSPTVVISGGFGFRSETFGQVVVGTYFPNPLIVVDVLVAGDEDAGDL